MVTTVFPYISPTLPPSLLPSLEQEAMVVNYPSPDTEFTRIVEYKHVPNQPEAVKQGKVKGSLIAKEVSSAEGDPYYPVPNPENRALYERCEEQRPPSSNPPFLPPYFLALSPSLPSTPPSFLRSLSPTLPSSLPRLSPLLPLTSSSLLPPAPSSLLTLPSPLHPPIPSAQTLLGIASSLRRRRECAS